MALAQVLPREQIISEVKNPEELCKAESGWTTLRPERHYPIPPAFVLGKFANKLSDDNPIGRSSFRVPKITLSKYQNVKFIPGQFILAGDDLISGDSCEEPVFEEDKIWYRASHSFQFGDRRASFPRLAGYAHWGGHNQVNLKPLLDRPVRKITEPVFALTAWYHSNVCHWLLDFFGRLWGLPFMKEKNFKILVPDNKQPFIRESLNLLGIGEENLIYYNNASILDIEILYSTSRLASQYNYISPEIVNFYENLENFIPNFEAGGDELIYISRRDSRRRVCTNEEEVEVALDELGFKIVSLTELSIVERIKLFRGCKLLVGACGAGMSHSILLPNNTHVCATGSPEMHFHSNFLLNIAAIKKQNVALIPGISEESDNAVTNSWSLDIEDTRRSIERFMAHVL